MLAKTRQLMAPQKGIQPPTDMAGWQKLMAQVIDRAQKIGQNVTGLQAAYAKGNSEQMLRRMGIICPTDINREFPTK